jgi:hypothetical protein
VPSVYLPSTGGWGGRVQERRGTSPSWALGRRTRNVTFGGLEAQNDVQSAAWPPVYAELGTTFASCAITFPTVCAHILGQLMQAGS